MFLERQINILEWFPKGHVTEDWIKLHFKIY